MHAPLGPGRCWECGSDAHLKPQCPLLGQGGKASGGGAAGTGKGSGGATQGAPSTGQNSAPSTGQNSSPSTGQNSSSSTTTPTAATAGTSEEKPRRGRRKGGGKERGPKEAVRKSEEEPSVQEEVKPPPASSEASARTEFFEEATKALKSLRLARITLRALQTSGCKGRALVDSGATTSMRTARGGEAQGLPLRKVLLAEGETTFYQLPGGTLLTTKATAPIVAMSDLMEVGCRVTWCSSEGCNVVHPVRGDLGARVVNGCPEIDEEVGLELIEEAERTKLRRREAELAVNRLVEGCEATRLGGRKMDWDLGAKAAKDLRNGVGLSWAWLHQTFPEAPTWLISSIPVVAEVDGERVPWNRHERKKWKRASALAVHLFCGKDRSTWKSRAEAAHVVTVDQAEDVMADATYSALLELALSGKLRMVFGGPPCRTFSALRNRVMNLGEGPQPLRDREGDGRWGRDGLTEWETWRVATATARANGESDPDFLLEHPEDPKLSLRESGWASLWEFPEVKFLREEMKWFWWEFDQGPLGHPRRKPTRVLASMHCPRELRDVRGPSAVSEEECDHDGDGFRSATWAAWAPGLKQVIKRMVESSLAGATLERVMKLDQAFLDHLQRDHIPYRRDCRACLAGSFRGHVHRRVVAPDAWCLSLDVIGPAKQGDDEQLKKVKYGLIATLSVPDVLGKLLQPPEPQSADDGGGVGEILEDPLWDDAEMADDEAEDLSAAERARGMREEAKWDAMVTKDKIDDVKMIEVPFFKPLSSKNAAEVLGATKEILLQVKQLGLAVKRVHSDCGREFTNKGFRALCADRGLIRTTTGGDNYKSNGRVEALVGRAKNAVRTMLSATGLDAAYWSFAMRHYVAKMQWNVVTQLGGRYPRLPPFGTKVFVKKRSWKLIKEEFVEKVVAAKILCPSPEVARGFLVKTEEGSYLTTMVAVENVKETSGQFEVDAPPARGDEPGVRRRLRGKTAIARAEVESEVLAKLSPEDSEHLIQDEELAAIFLEAGDYSMSAVEELLQGLWLGEQPASNRRAEECSEASWVSVHVLGMYRHGGVVGTTTLARTRPLLTQFLVQAMKQQMGPETTFTTLSINYNTPMQCHKDFNNQRGQPACLVGYGNYVGGSLWCHQPNKQDGESVDWHKVDGKWLPGRRHPTYHKAVKFNPRELHQPLPWQGCRITVTAYTAGCAENCKESHYNLLQELGFPLPPRKAQAIKPEGGAGGGGHGSVEKSKSAVRFLGQGGPGPGRIRTQDLVLFVQAIYVVQDRGRIRNQDLVLFVQAIYVVQDRGRIRNQDLVLFVQAIYVVQDRGSTRSQGSVWRTKVAVIVHARGGRWIQLFVFARYPRKVCCPLNRSISSLVMRKKGIFRMRPGGVSPGQPLVLLLKPC